MGINKMRFLFVFSLLFSCLYSNGQSLQLSDLYKIYSLDSITLLKFCHDKNFEIKKIKEDKQSYFYEFNSIEDKKISFVRTFSKERNVATVTYYFNSNIDC
jgi:hypothetical protein